MFKRLFSRFAATAALAAGIAALSVSDVPLLADNPPDASIAASSQTFVGDVKNAVDTARIGLVADQSSFVLYVCSQDEAFNKTSARWVRGIVTNGKFEGKSPDSALTVRGTIGMEAAEGTITVGGNEMTFAAKLPDERTFAGLYRCEEKDTTNDYIAGWVVDEDDAVAGAIQNRQNKQITNPPGVAAQQKPNPKGNVVSPRGGNRIPNLDVGQGTGVGGQQVTDPKKLDRTHTFSKAGTFTATVTVTDDDGSSSSQYQVTVADEISPPPPPPPLNTPPTISDLANQASNGSTIGPIAFTVGDAETAADGLVVTAQSNNTTLVNNVILGGSGANRTVTFTPVEGRFGTAILSLTVRDAQGAIATDTFTVTISPPPPATPRPILVGFPEFAAGADAGGGSATLFNPDKSVRFTVTPFAGFTGGVRTATADFNGDGVADLIVGTGPGIATRVVILDGKIASGAVRCRTVRSLVRRGRLRLRR